MIKEELLNLDLFIVNSYFDAYVNLIVNNLDTKKIKGVTERHHIIPVLYYTQNKLDINNSKSNLVDLNYKDHVYAHYLLYKCSSNKYKYRLRNAILQVFNNSGDNLARFDKLSLEEKEKILNNIQLDYEANNISMPEDIRLHHKEAANNPEVKAKNSKAVKKAYANMSLERKNLLKIRVKYKKNYTLI